MVSFRNRAFLLLLFLLLSYVFTSMLFTLLCISFWRYLSCVSAFLEFVCMKSIFHPHRRTSFRTLISMSRLHSPTNALKVPKSLHQRFLVNLTHLKPFGEQICGVFICLMGVYRYIFASITFTHLFQYTFPNYSSLCMLVKQYFSEHLYSSHFSIVWRMNLHLIFAPLF